MKGKKHGLFSLVALLSTINFDGMEFSKLKKNRGVTKLCFYITSGEIKSRISTVYFAYKNRTY